MTIEKSSNCKRNIIIYTVADCIACEYVIDTIHKLCKNKDIEIICISLVGNLEKAKKANGIKVVPTVVFNINKTEVAKINGSMGISFYENVIDNFEKL